MKISIETVKRVANLAKLSFSEEQLPVMAAEMEKILGFMDKLNELDTDNVEPLVYLVQNANPLRPDEPKPALTVAEALSNAPSANSDYFKVPKMIEREG